MDEFNDNKFKSMVDEMTRFEEEIGLPYNQEPDKRLPPGSQPFVIGTNTFSRAQQKLQLINPCDGSETVFVPNQVVQRSSVSNQGPVPPPPPPPIAVQGSGITYNNPIPSNFNQPIPPPPQPPAFTPTMFLRPEAINRSSGPASSNLAFARRPPPPSWVPRTNFRPPTAVPVPDKKVDINPDGIQKVVVSATPKLYTPAEQTLDAYAALFTKPTTQEYTRPVEQHLVPHKPKKSLEHKKESKKESSSKKESTKAYTLPNITGSYDLSASRKVKPIKTGNKKLVRVSGGQAWEDPTLAEWEEGDFRLFCGDLGNDVTDELLTRIFSRYPSFLKARVVRDKRTNKTKGFGFISFKDPQDFIKASKEMNGRYVGSRPIKLRKSTWKNRNLETVKKKEKEKAALIAMLTGKN